MHDDMYRRLCEKRKREQRRKARTARSPFRGMTPAAKCGIVRVHTNHEEARA